MRSVVAAALLLVAWPTAAQAVDLGGGTPADSVRQAPRQLTLVGVHPIPNGVGLTVRVAARCGSAHFAQPTPVGTDGRFGIGATIRSSVGNGVRRTARFVVAGQIAGTVASGTARVRLTFRRHGRVVARCRSGTRSWQARAATAQPAPAAARPNGAYYGLTTPGGRAFVLSVSPDGRSVETASFVYRRRCARRSFELANVTPGGSIAADGTFHLRERFTFHYAEGNERFRVAVDGRFTTTGVSGALSVTSVLRTRGGGRVLDRCSTGATTFAAVL